jgi:hypothetical protein
MEPEHSAIAWIRALLALPRESGERFPEEWDTVRHRIEAVHAARLPHETDPAVAPRLRGRGE